MGRQGVTLPPHRRIAEVLAARAGHALDEREHQADEAEDEARPHQHLKGGEGRARRGKQQAGDDGDEAVEERGDLGEDVGDCDRAAHLR